MVPRSLLEVDRRFKVGTAFVASLWSQYAPLKRRSTSTKLHGSTPHKRCYLHTRRSENLKSHQSGHVFDLLQSVRSEVGADTLNSHGVNTPA
jgi:hypothetical protein